ncbi:MAG: hypothetical protein K0S01_2938 [Herbinix sp.]|jgi:hypothetical protein|nr:hypothetical protein [Herbinix sp.]
MISRSELIDIKYLYGGKNYGKEGTNISRWMGWT